MRDQFERCGYSLEDVTDSELEAAVTADGIRIESEMPLTGKQAFWVLRRISPGGETLRGRRPVLTSAARSTTVGK